MPRKKAVTAPVLLKAWIPPELRAKMDLELVSELEGRVPHGDISQFVIARFKEHFDWVSLDLSLYGFPQGYFVRGPAAMVEALREAFNAKR